MVTLEKFFDYIDSLKVHPGDLIVNLMYKYDYEKQFTQSNEILEYDGNTNDWIWLNDWDEGYTSGGEVYVFAFIPVSDIHYDCMYKMEDINK